MATYARRNCARYPGVSIGESDFEQWVGDDGGFRLINSAQAWHWVAPEVRYRRARELLDDGGALAVWAGEYVAQLHTHSDHILLSDEERTPLLTAVAAAIERHGGTTEFAYRTWLYLARAKKR